MRNYAINGPISLEKVVECWSKCRLPFDNLKDWQKAQRSDLTQALKKLEASPGENLSAVYLSPNDGGRFDAENILFYNVGSGAFKNAALNGLEFESAISSMPPPVDSVLGTSDLHYHRYELHTERAGFRYWKPSTEPIRMTANCSRTLNSSIKPEIIWHAMKTSTSLRSMACNRLSSNFALLVTIKSRNASMNLSAIIKPLFDGIISAFHRYVGSELDQVSQRLADRLSAPQSEIATFLSDDRLALLGDRTVVHPRGNSVQWNPKDDDCVAGALYLEPDLNLTSGFEMKIDVVPVIRA